MDAAGTGIKTPSASFAWVIVQTLSLRVLPVIFSKRVEIFMIGSVGWSMTSRTTRVPKVESTGPVSLTPALITSPVNAIESKPRGGGQFQSDCGAGHALSPPKE